MVTIKEYAKKQNKSVQAVYKQLNAKSNQKKLEGHIYKNEINGKMTTFLDEVAEEILSNSSKEAPVVLEKITSNERIESLEAENKALLIKIAELQEALLKEKDTVKLLQEDKIKLLEQKNEEQPKKKTLWQFLKGEK